MKTNCRKCINLVRESKWFDEIVCSKFRGVIHEPCYCAKFMTPEQFAKEQAKKKK